MRHPGVKYNFITLQHHRSFNLFYTIILVLKGRKQIKITLNVATKNLYGYFTDIRDFICPAEIDLSLNVLEN